MPPTDDKAGLIETPENNVSESKVASSEKPKSSRKSQDHRRRKPAKIVTSADKAKVSSQGGFSTDSASIEDQSQEAV